MLNKISLKTKATTKTPKRQQRVKGKLEMSCVFDTCYMLCLDLACLTLIHLGWNASSQIAWNQRKHLRLFAMIAPCRNKRIPEFIIGTCAPQWHFKRVEFVSNTFNLYTCEKNDSVLLNQKFQPSILIKERSNLTPLDFRKNNVSGRELMSVETR